MDAAGQLERVRQICLALPEAHCETHGGHASFTIRKKTFTYFLNNHHGDGIVGINCKVLPGDNAALVKSDPAKFYMPAYLAARGWVGLRLNLPEIDLPEIDWQEVADLIAGSYQLIAPKKLAALLEARDR